jgi:hypothetical protein
MLFQTSADEIALFFSHYNRFVGSYKRPIVSNWAQDKAGLEWRLSYHANLSLTWDRRQRRTGRCRVAAFSVSLEWERKELPILETVGKRNRFGR